MTDANAVLHRRMPLLVDAQSPFGDLLRLVADALEIGDDLADAEYQAQIGGGRLATGDDVRAVVVDGLFQLVDPLVGLDDVLDRVHLTGLEGIDGGGNLRLDQAAHLQDQRAHSVEVFVELAGKMFVHVVILRQSQCISRTCR